jgi:hypothetical protein
MNFEEICHIKHNSIHCDPTIALGSVIREFLSADERPLDEFRGHVKQILKNLLNVHVWKFMIRTFHAIQSTHSLAISSPVIQMRLLILFMSLTAPVSGHLCVFMPDVYVSDEMFPYT